MRTLRITVVCTLLLGGALFSGCSDEGPTTPNTVADLGSDAVELIGADEVTLGMEKSAGGVRIRMSVNNTIEVVPPYAPPILNAIFRGPGTSRPFGPFELYSPSQIDVTVYPQIQVSDMIMTFSNGDELHSHAVGSAIEDPPGIAVFHGDLEFTGGTGRFTNATGAGTYAGTADVGAAIGQFDIEGVISGFGMRDHH